MVLSESVGILACGLARSLRITMHICLFIQYLSYNIYLEEETFSCSAFIILGICHKAQQYEVLCHDLDLWSLLLETQEQEDGDLRLTWATS